MVTFGPLHFAEGEELHMELTMPVKLHVNLGAFLQSMFNFCTAAESYQ